MIYENIPMKYLVNEPFMNLVNHLYQMLIVANVAHMMRESLIDTEYDNDGDLVASGKAINVLTTIHDNLKTNVKSIAISLNENYIMILRDMTENEDNTDDDAMKVWNEVTTKGSQDIIFMLDQKSEDLCNLISPLLIDCNICFITTETQARFGDLHINPY